MKKLHLLKTMLLLCALIVGSSSVWATVPNNPKWIATALADISDNATVIIISNSSTATNIALPSTATTSSPAKKACTVTTTDGVTTITPPAGTTLQALAWTLKKESTSYKFFQEGSSTIRLYLGKTNSNTALKVGDAESNNDTFVMGDAGKLLKVTTAERYVGPYDNDGSDWRTYSTENATNYKGAELTFYVLRTTVPVTGVTLNKTETSIVEGNTETLTATVAPAEATNKNVSWSSNKTSVADVDDDGVVTAKAEGEATITVTTEDGSFTATCTVTVTSASAPNADVSTGALDFGDVEVGQSKNLTFTVTPANLTGALTIASNNAKYAISPTSIAQDATTAQTITVTASPTALNDNMSGAITISGGGIVSKTVTLTATPYQVASVTLVASGNNGTFEKDDATITSLTSRVGSSATIKAVPNSGYKFDSWSATGATPASSTDDETEFTFTAASVTLTAIFSVRLTDNYVKVTDASTLRAGDQLLVVYEDGNKALGAINTGSTNDYYSGVDVTIDTEAITIDDEEVAVLTLGGEEDAWTLKSSLSNKYLKLPSNANALSESATADSDYEKWEISISGGDANITNVQFSGNSRYIQWNTSSPRFACYQGKQKNVQLYRKCENATVTSVGYATYCSPKALNFSTTGVKVYTATDNNATVKLNEITSGQVPANTPVVLYKDGGASVNVPVIASASAVGSNDLEVSDGTTAKGDGIYVLSNKSKGVGFYPWVSASSLSAGKVFLRVAGGSTAREFIGFDGGETTAISEVRGLKSDVRGEYFNLNGQRVAQPTKGLYIVNGKKVMFK